MLGSASNLLLDLEVVENDVALCFPSQIDAVEVFVSSYNFALEEEVRLKTTPLHFCPRVCCLITNHIFQ